MSNCFIEPPPPPPPPPLTQFFFQALNNNFSYTQLSFVFLLQKNYQFDHDDADVFFLFFFRKAFISVLDLFNFFLFLLQKDFDIFRVLLLEVFICFFSQYLFTVFIYIQKNVNFFYYLITIFIQLYTSFKISSKM